jgi:transcriptional regulator with XRE-family HTH domain
MAKKKDNTLAASLRRHRLALGWTQQDLAVTAGLSVGIVSQLEQGATGDPRISTLSAIARALGCGVDALIAGTEFGTTQG